MSCMSKSICFPRLGTANSGLPEVAGTWRNRISADGVCSEVKIARHSVGWEPKTTFREIRASVAAQGGLGPGIGEDEKTTGVEYKNEDES